MPSQRWYLTLLPPSSVPSSVKSASESYDRPVSSGQSSYDTDPVEYPVSQAIPKAGRRAPGTVLEYAHVLEHRLSVAVVGDRRDSVYSRHACATGRAVRRICAVDGGLLGLLYSDTSPP